MKKERKMKKERTKDMKCPQSVEIERFIDSDAVQDLVKGVLRKRKIDSIEESVVARAYLMKRKCGTLKDM